MDLVDEALRRLTLLLSYLLDHAYAIVDPWDVDVPALDWLDDQLHRLVMWRLSRRPAAKEALRVAVEFALDDLVQEARVDFSQTGISIAPQLRVVGVL